MPLVVSAVRLCTQVAPKSTILVRVYMLYPSSFPALLLLLACRSTTTQSLSMRQSAMVAGHIIAVPQLQPVPVSQERYHLLAQPLFRPKYLSACHFSGRQTSLFLANDVARNVHHSFSCLLTGNGHASAADAAHTHTHMQRHCMKTMPVSRCCRCVFISAVARLFLHTRLLLLLLLFNSSIAVFCLPNCPSICASVTATTVSGFMWHCALLCLLFQLARLFGQNIDRRLFAAIIVLLPVVDLLACCSKGAHATHMHTCAAHPGVCSHRLAALLFVAWRTLFA